MIRILLSHPAETALRPYRALAKGATQHLTTEGCILVEIGWQQGPDVAAIFAERGLSKVRILPDLDGRDRVVLHVSPRQTCKNANFSLKSDLYTCHSSV